MGVILEKLAKSAWVRWLGTLPFLLLAAALVLYAETVWIGLGHVAILLSFFAGPFFGVAIAKFLLLRFGSLPEEQADRAINAFQIFGFLALPPIVAIALLGTEFLAMSWQFHLLGALAMSALAFLIPPTKD